MTEKAKGDEPAAARGAFETTVFRSGNSDAVRLPKRLALTGHRVRVRALGDGRLIIEPARGRQWPKGFLESFGRMSGYFELPAGHAGSAIDEERAAQFVIAPPSGASHLRSEFSQPPFFDETKSPK